MAPVLPVLSGDEVVRAFERLGWENVRQQGGHVLMTKAGQRASLSIPIHSTVAKGTLRGLFRASGHGIEDFVRAARS
jgi:predicted RNA binding protein YcfA (HicA-like mRNA interferase family)